MNSKKFTIPSDAVFEEKTNTTFRQEKTYNGYDTGELKSWLQKAIRRSRPDQAAWAAVELYTLPKQSVVTNLFNRLRIIAMEDIGVANPNAVKCVEEILSGLETVKGKPKLPVKAEGVLKIASLAAYLAQSKHLRLCSDYKAVFMTPEIRPQLSNLFPDIYKDHTAAISFINKNKDPKILGKKMVEMLEKKNDCAFYLMASILDLETLPFKTMRSQNPAYYILDLIGKLAEKLEVEFSPEIEILAKWLKGGIINSKIDYNLPLYYAMLMILKRDEMVDPGFDCAKEVVEVKNFLPKVKAMKVPEYALDKHTMAGLRAGKTAVDFANEGALVENEDESLLNPEFRELYLRSKTLKPGDNSNIAGKTKTLKAAAVGKTKVVEKTKVAEIPLESEIIDFDIRVQATVADSRCDTYFGVERSTGRRIFVKGPYKNRESAMVPVTAYEIKKVLDPKLPSIKLEMRMMKPDLFPDLPWGFRRHSDREEGHWFLISDNILTVDPIPRRMHNTKVWGDVEVVNWSKIKEPSVPAPLKLKGAALDNYVINMIFRYALGIPDQADRNFMLMNDNTIYSVDEEGIGSDTNFKNALKEKKCEVIRKYIKSEAGWKKLSLRLKGWLESYKKNKTCIEILTGKSSWLHTRLMILQDQEKTAAIFGP
jgi:copper chaperone CopZ